METAKQINVSKWHKTKTVLSLALPAMAENLLQSMVGFVDTYFVAKLGLIEVAAVGVSNAILQVYFAIFMSIGVASTVLIAQAVGAGNVKRARHVAKQSALLTGWVGFILGLAALLFAKPLLLMMGAGQDILEPSIVYWRIVAGPSIFIALMFVLGSLLRGAGDTKTPMKVSVWINALHAALDYLLIFGIGSWSGWGLAGAAWATVIVRILGVVLLIRALKRKNGLLSHAEPTDVHGISERHFWTIDRSIWKQLIALGSPAAAERLFMRVGQIVYFGMIIRMGTEVYAAHQLAGNITIFGYMAGYGLATAATTLVGQSLGAGRKEEARQYGWITMWLGIVIMTVVGVAVYLASSWYGQIMTSDTKVIELIRAALRIDLFAQPATAAVVILTGAVQGTGDTKFPMYTTAIGMWAVRTLGVYVLGVWLGLGLSGVWLAILLDNWLRAVLLVLRFRFWKQQKSLPF